MTARPAAAEAAPSTRQWLTPRQSATVDAIIGAGITLLRDVGFADFTMREAARRAGVTHTTAYTYFGSKEHLVAELQWRLLRALPEPDHRPDDPLATRIAAALEGPSELFTDEPKLSEAVLAAMVVRDPEIDRLRDAAGAELARRIRTAVGSAADERIVEAALLLFSGAMLQAGLGYTTFSEAVERIATVVELFDA